MLFSEEARYVGAGSPARQPGKPLLRSNAWSVEKDKLEQERFLLARRPESSSSKVRSLCRALGLSLFYDTFSRNRRNGKPVVERRKIALRGDRYIAGLAGAIHLLPMSAAISLCSLNLAGYYVGGELSGTSGKDTEKFAGLQFAAKVHELTINASLAAMILSYIRQELAVGGGVPFGAIFAGMRFQDISVLWSLEFWGAVYAKETKRGRKWILLTLVLTGALLELESEGYMPTAIQIAGPRSVRQVVLATSSWVSQFGSATSSAFMPYAAVAGALTEAGRYWAWAAKNVGGKWRFQYRRNAVYDVSTIQPLVHTKCFALDPSQYSRQWNASNDTLPFYDLSNVGSKFLNGVASFNKTLPKIEFLLPSTINRTNSSGTPLLSWYSIPQPASNNMTLAAIAFVPALQFPVFTCTVDARQMPILQRNQREPVQMVDSLEPGYVNPSSNGLIPISLDPKWADYLNPTILQPKMTAFGAMVRSAGLWNTTQKTDEWLNSAVMESIIALMVVNGIARSNWKYGMVGNLKGLSPDSNNNISNGCAEWCQHMMPLGRRNGYGGSAFDLDASLYPNATKLTMHAHAKGYAYSSKGTTAKVSIVILLLYATLAVSHWIYLFWNGQTSSSWDSSGELAALALNSSPTDKLRNTGAGIESTEVFAEQVRVIAVGDRLELAFDRTPDQGKIELNGFYG